MPTSTFYTPHHTPCPILHIMSHPHFMPHLTHPVPPYTACPTSHFILHLTHHTPPTISYPTSHITPHLIYPITPYTTSSTSHLIFHLTLHAACHTLYPTSHFMPHFGLHSPISITPLHHFDLVQLTSFPTNIFPIYPMFPCTPSLNIFHSIYVPLKTFHPVVSPFSYKYIITSI